VQYLIAILSLALLTLVVVLLYGFVAFDRLVRAEYLQFRSDWERDGRPAGFFWRASECDFISSGLAKLTLSFAWLFRTPRWIAGSPELLAHLRRQRFAILIWNFGILILVAAVFVAWHIYGRIV
jgi:hypothetical protein